MCIVAVKIKLVMGCQAWMNPQQTAEAGYAAQLTMNKPLVPATLQRPTAKPPLTTCY